MSSRTRQVTNRPSVGLTPSRATVQSDELPPYKKPSHPLDANATKAIRELQGRDFGEVKKHNSQALKTIVETAESVNDMLRLHTDYIERRQKKWDAGKNLDDQENETSVMQELQERVDQATAKLEESMRAVIDSGMATRRLGDTLEWLKQNAPAQLEEEYQTQMTQRATQRQSQSQVENQQGRMQDGEDEARPTPGPTPLDGSRVALTGASEIYAARMQHEKDAYTKLSLTVRYARNNDYRDFKRIVHDAKYGDNGPTLGHEDTWFTETGSPAPGITDASRRGDFDDDDDILMDKVTISTKCPITFQQLKEPFTSTKCPHTFEKNAILDMIRTSRGPGGKQVECPIPGCGQFLSTNDFRSDPIIIRKIKRIQQAEREAAEESSDDEDLSDDIEQSESTLHVPSTQQPPQSSIVEDLGDPSDSDEEMG
ncbi:hypothetical protein ACN47E_000655 [Coniothyrium glycines]